MKKTVLSLSLALALLVPSAAQAQEGYQRTPPAAGEEVIVTQSTSGTELRGRIVELSKTTLAILVNGQRVDVPIDNVLRIDARTDSVKNGAAIGAVVSGAWVAIGCSLVGGDGGGNRAAYCVAGGLVYAGIGALVGAGIDALHKGRTTIYSKPASVALAVAPTRKGARAQFSVRW